MERKTPRWESELWSYLSHGDGTHCPMYLTCQLKVDNARCYSENEEYTRSISEFIDEDELELSNPAGVKFEFSTCPRSGIIFQLVRKLANRSVEEAVVDYPPVPTDLITHTDDGLPIEIRRIPLKAHRGSVWKLRDCWVIQLNSNDSSARQRFTLYHEIFHIFAHGKATPVFKKAGGHREGSFNEMLADHFSGSCLLPEKLVKEMWPRIKDVSQMAATFDVPKPVVWFALKRLGLI
jgi:hypothetical protein